MVPAVAIDVPNDVPAAIAVAALSSCRSAIGDERCVLADSNDSTMWYATIRVADGEPLRLRIEFRARGAAHPNVVEKVLTFSDRDDLPSRWASAGLVIAGLVAAEDAVPPKPSEPTPHSEAPKPIISGPSPALGWGLDAGGLTGPGLQHGAYRVGGFARGWIASDSGVVVDASLRLAGRGGDPAVTWWSIAAGVGGRLGAPRNILNAEVVGELVAERMTAQATDPKGGREDSGGQSRFGGRLSLITTMRLSNGLRVLLGLDTTALTPQVDVAVKSVVVDREPPLRFSIVGGIRGQW
jgi:hypothetical protein